METAPPETTGPAPAPVKAPLLGRPVVWAGLATGTAVTVLAVVHGIRFPGLQVVLSVLVTWLLLMVLAVTVAELARRHHRAAARHAWRHSRRGTRWLTVKAAARWARRQPAGDPEPPPPYVTAPDDRARSRRVDGKPETETDTRFFDLRESGYTGPIDQNGNPTERTRTTMTDTKVTDDSTSSRPRSRRPTGGSSPAPWNQVIAGAADFEPEDDGHLLAWMAGEVAGMSAYAEALTEVYETCVNTVGLDPVAMQATHDVADAAADAATAMAAARVKFASHYSEVREFAANGGLLPFDGRWVKGEGDA